MNRYTDRPMANRSLYAKFEVRSSSRSEAIVITTNGRTDRHSSNVLEFRADQMSPRILWSQINISRCYASIDLYEEGTKTLAVNSRKRLKNGQKTF